MWWWRWWWGHGARFKNIKNFRNTSSFSFLHFRSFVLYRLYFCLFCVCRFFPVVSGRYNDVKDWETTLKHCRVRVCVCLCVWGNDEQCQKKRSDPFNSHIRFYIYVYIYNIRTPFHCLFNASFRICWIERETRESRPDKWWSFRGMRRLFFRNMRPEFGAWHLTATGKKSSNQLCFLTTR